MNTQDMIFVFGSNEGGRHGAGAAAHARRYLGAVHGIGYGHTGQTFAIPTLDRRLQPISLMAIAGYIAGFLNYAVGRDDLMFQVTQVGCGLAGLKARDIAPMFELHPNNCFFDTAWKPYLPVSTKFWGTF